MIPKKSLSRQLDKRVEACINAKSNGKEGFSLKIGEIAEEVGEEYFKVRHSITRLEERGLLRTRQSGKGGLYITLFKLTESDKEKAEEELRERKRRLRKKAFKDTLTKQLEPQLMINKNLEKYLKEVESIM